MKTLEAFFALSAKSLYHLQRLISLSPSLPFLDPL
jgi:hypothetical protein